MVEPVGYPVVERGGVEAKSLPIPIVTKVVTSQRR